MMKRIVIINGHPNLNSFNQSIVDRYAEGAKEANATVDFITISTLSFDPNLPYGYQQRMELEPDLQDAWKKIKAADHMVWIHPVWWGGLPAKTKGFIDRLFLPGFTFKFKENSIWWDKLLKGKSGRIIYTMDQPVWYYRLINKRPSLNALKKMTLEFCGVSPVRSTGFGPTKTSSAKKRKQFLDKVYHLGKSQL